MKKISIVLVLTIFVLVVSVSTLKVKHIQIQNNANCLNEKNLQEKINNKNLIFLDTDNLKNDLKKQLECIEDLKITKKYPGTVDFTLIQKQAVAKIDGSQYSLTEDGLAISDTSTTPKPTIFLPQGVQVDPGQKLKDPSVLFALQLSKNLEKSDFIASNVRITDQGDIAVYSSQEAIALFTKEKSAQSQVDSLQSVIAKAKIDPSKIAKIDLRFEKPVLIYKQPQ